MINPQQLTGLEPSDARGGDLGTVADGYALFGDVGLAEQRHVGGPRDPLQQEEGGPVPFAGAHHAARPALLRRVDEAATVEPLLLLLLLLIGGEG